MTALAGWKNFYVIVGSSAGALIGLQFIVITLIADMPMARGQESRPGACYAYDRSFPSRAAAVSHAKRAASRTRSSSRGT